MQEGTSVSHHASAALEAIDRAHLDGELPVTPVVASRAEHYNGEFEVRRELDGSVEVSIRVSGHGDTPSLTTVHEVGHFVDRAALGTPGSFASENAPEMAAWRQAVGQIDAVRSLRALHAVRSVVAPSAHGPVQTLVNHRHVAYVTTCREMWARSYAQFVALRSGNVNPLVELNRRRNAVLGVVHSSRWSNDDFEPIAAAAEELLKRRGWMP